MFSRQLFLLVCALCTKLVLAQLRHLLTNGNTCGTPGCAPNPMRILRYFVQFQDFFSPPVRCTNFVRAMARKVMRRHIFISHAVMSLCRLGTIVYRTRGCRSDLRKFRPSRRIATYIEPEIPGTCHRHHRAQRVVLVGLSPTADRRPRLEVVLPLLWGR